MHPYRQLVVGVALNGHDAVLADHAAAMARLAPADRVRFVHVTPHLIAPADADPEAEQTRALLAAEIRTQAEAFVRDHVRVAPPTEATCEIVEGTPLSEVLRAARDGDADLLIAGRGRRGGTLAVKLSRKAPCSVLVVPEHAPAADGPVLVAVDLSAPAADALAASLRLAEADGHPVHVLYVFRVSTSYLKLGLTHEEAKASAETGAREQLGAWLTALDIGGAHIEPHVVESDDTAEAIHAHAEAVGARMVVIGARGQSAAAAVLLGSVAEETVQTARRPLLVVKAKGANQGLLDMLLEV